MTRAHAVMAKHVERGDVLVGVYSDDQSRMSRLERAHVLDIINDYTVDNQHVILLRTTSYGGPWLLAETLVQVIRSDRS